MPEPLDAALTEVRALLLDPAPDPGGRRRTASWAAPLGGPAELRPVTLKAGPRLQIATSDGARPHTRNVAPGRRGRRGGRRTARRAVRQLARGDGRHDAPTTGDQVRRGAGAPGRGDPSGGEPGGHDRAKDYLLDPGDPIFAEIGGSAAKRRQVDAFLRALAATLPDDLTGPLRVVDLGCGNAYLTFAAYRYLTQRGLDVDLVGVDVREDQRRRNTELAQRLGWADQVSFVAGTIADAVVDPAPDLVLALHACDTATDEALARAVRWEARWVLAAPCCHHDLAKQLRARPRSGPVRAADPAGHPARALRRRAHRRAARRAATGARVPGRGGGVRRLPAHARATC